MASPSTIASCFMVVDFLVGGSVATSHQPARPNYWGIELLLSTAPRVHAREGSCGHFLRRINVRAEIVPADPGDGFNLQNATNGHTAPLTDRLGRDAKCLSK